MFMPIGISWHVRRAPGLPLLELSATIQKTNLYIENMQVFYLQIALKMISVVEKFNGILIPPFGNIPNDKDLFFTAQFASNIDVETFLNNSGWERIG